MTDTHLNLSQIARIAGVGRAAVANWRRRHADFPAPVGGTAASSLFTRAAAEQWLHDHDLMPLPPEPPRPPATVTFENGATLTVYGPELRSPAHPWSGGEGYEEFSGHIEPDRPGIPWPKASARIAMPGRAPYAVTGADVDISGYGGRMDFLKLIWRTECGTSATDPQTAEVHR